MNKLKMAEKIQREIVAVAGVVVTVGEIALSFLHPSPAKTTLQTVLPLVATWRVRARTVPVSAFEAVVQRLEKKHK